MSVNERLATLSDIAGMTYVPSHEPPDWTAGSSRSGAPERALAELGWRATTSLAEGLRRTWDFVRDTARPTD